MAQSKRWCYTLNNYTDEERQTLVDYPNVYHVVGKEVGENGTPHLQGYFVFKTAKRLAAMKKVSSRAHWEVAKGSTDANFVYCTKDGDFGEYGIRPKTPKETGEEQHARWLDVIRSAKDGTCEEEYPKEFVQYNGTITRMLEPTCQIIDEYTGHWWWGPPGSGKSRQARVDYPDLYDKLINKWWDQYVDQEVVLIDDLDPTHTFMGLFLKRYADHYPFRAEHKGGSRVIRPKVIIVTSNYSIEDIFGNGSEMCKAIQRRYQVRFFE